MFHYQYLSTKDRKGNTHQYKLPAGEAAPTGHEITALRVAGTWTLAEVIEANQLLGVAAMFPELKRKKPQRKPGGTVPWSETKAKMQKVMGK